MIISGGLTKKCVVIIRRAGGFSSLFINKETPTEWGLEPKMDVFDSSELWCRNMYPNPGRL
ncbi:hypothetical protein HMPREF9374_3912 [Desmospora sp. 8437]|nr:hypothetical protein HMPREF9374_3912 [Desmospora sp. 8437]